ncbi:MULTISPECIES: hypothetical protein [Paraburkholderia]
MNNSSQPHFERIEPMSAGNSQFVEASISALSHNQFSIAAISASVP